MTPPLRPVNAVFESPPTPPLSLAPPSLDGFQQPCDACVGVSTFVFRRNRRVDEALRRLDRSERLEEQAAVLTASNASLLEKLLHTEVAVFSVVLSIALLHNF